MGGDCESLWCTSTPQSLCILPALPCPPARHAPDVDRCPLPTAPMRRSQRRWRARRGQLSTLVLLDHLLTSQITRLQSLSRPHHRALACGDRPQRWLLPVQGADRMCSAGARSEDFGGVRSAAARRRGERSSAAVAGRGGGGGGGDCGRRNCAPRFCVHSCACAGGCLQYEYSRSVAKVNAPLVLL